MIRRTIKVLQIIIILTIMPIFVGKLRFIQQGKNLIGQYIGGVLFTLLFLAVLAFFYLLAACVYTYIKDGRFEFDYFWDPFD